MPYEGKDVKPLVVKDEKGEIVPSEPIGCHLQTIGGVAGCFEWGNDGAAQFDALMKRNHGKGDGYRGQYHTATLVSIDSRSSKKTIEELEKRGFKLLGTQKGGHSCTNYPYNMLLYGHGFTLPGEVVPKEEPKAKLKEKRNAD